MDQQKHIERDLQEKSDRNRQRAEELELMVHKGKEGERKELIELQIKLSQMTQEKPIKEEYSSKQLLELKQQMQSEMLEKERLQIEVKSLEERNMHEQQLSRQRFELQQERDKADTERQMTQ